LNTSLSTAAIILAAGSSSRMGGGRHKLLLPLGDRPVIAHVIDASLASQARPIMVILGHQSDQVRTQIKQYTLHQDIALIVNPHYQQGMSSSLRMGIQTVLANGYKKNTFLYQVGSALIVLGDQPLITPQIIDTLITTYRTTGMPIVAPLYKGKRGSPVLFDKSLFSELMEVTGDEGGRTVLERHRHEVELIEIGDALTNYDVDTWEAYEQVVEAWKDQKPLGTKEPLTENRKMQAQLWLEYGQQLSNAIRYTEALAAIERAVSLDEMNVEAWYAKGTCMAMLARYDEALEAFEHALILDENYVPAWDGKAWALGILGRQAEALAAVNRALELDPEYFDAQKRKQRLEKM
jgi:molybdenum cofactor cytidylyltransferase